MRLALSVSLSIALIPPLFSFMSIIELYGTSYLKYALWFALITSLEFYVLAKRAYDIINTQESDIIFLIYQKTYERSIRFVPVISFLAIAVVALYALAPILALILLLPIAWYSSRVSYVTHVPFFSDIRKVGAEFFKTFMAMVVILLFVPIFFGYNSLEGIKARYYPVYEISKTMVYASPKILHDAFIRYSPLATLIASLVAVLARAGIKRGVILIGAALGFFRIVPRNFYSLSLTVFVFLVAMYERNSMNIGYSLMVPNVGSLSWIVPLGFTIVMTFVGGSLETYLNTTLIPASFIALLTFTSLLLGLILMRLLLKLPMLSGMKIGAIRL